jgi:hypothetical protein
MMHSNVNVAASYRVAGWLAGWLAPAVVGGQNALEKNEPTIFSLLLFEDTFS